MSQNAIAIIGLSCRFPGASDAAAFWDLLRSRKNTLSHFSDKELEQAGIDLLALQDKNYVKVRGILDNLDGFDEKKWVFTEEELANLSLQSRIFLQLVYQALEDAGINPESCPKETAVFTGANESIMPEKQRAFALQAHSMQPIMELAYARSLSAIVAYQLDLRGRSVSLHTGCSTSLVAIIQACEELLAGEASLAIAGGVSIDYPERAGYLHEEGGTLSPNGVCRPFDAQANGTVLSNGAGVVILKRLEDAIAAGDRIYSVILGKAMNNDGRLKTSFLAPSIKGQSSCIERAWKNAGLGIEEIDYIEAHGSATLVGDPIEILALKKLLKGQKYDKKWCGIGSVKSNIGHTTVASGMAAIIKAALMSHYREIIPTINFTELNKNIDLEHTPFYIASNYEVLANNKKFFHIAVSNFGFGGTNAHVVLGLPPTEEIKCNLSR